MAELTNQSEQEWDADQGIRALVAAGSREALAAHLDAHKPVDVAAEASGLAGQELRGLVELLADDDLAALAKGADDALRQRVAGILDDRRLLRVLAHMPSDDVVDILNDLDFGRRRGLVDGMEPDARASVTRLLQYPEQSAGGIMTTAFIALADDRTVGDALATIRAVGPRTEQIQTIYVLDAAQRLEGYVDLRRLLSSSRLTPVSRIMETHVISVDPYADQEEAADLVARYNLNALPVASDGQLLGVVTVDDIIDVIIEEYDEDLLRLAGANEEETLDTPLASSVRMRLPWLLVNLVTAFLASLVVRMFEGTIERVVALSAIMTIVSGMGGNAGSQTMAIAVRHLAREGLTRGEVLRALRKEVAAGIIDGAANGLVTGVVVGLLYHDPYLSLIVLVAMVANMVIAGTFGLLVPVTLEALRQDPAVASSIFVTTATDVLGFLVFLGLAQLLLPLLA